MARKPKDIMDALYRAVSRKSAPAVQRESARDLVARAEQALGSKKAVADRLGVSQRTVERWAAGEGRIRNKPSAKNADKLRDLGRNAPESRKRDMSNLRAARIRNKGAKIKVSGNIGPTIGGNDYKRQRTVEIDLSGEAMAPVLDAWLAGDDDAALAALHEALDSEYVAGFELDGEVDALDFLR